MARLSLKQFCTNYKGPLLLSLNEGQMSCIQGLLVKVQFLPILPFFYRNWHNATGEFLTDSVEPNNSQGLEDCADIWAVKDTHWLDTQCSMIQGYICKSMCISYK